MACLTICAGMLSLRAQELPEGKGKEIIERACVGCHKASELTLYRFTKDEYVTIVYRMGDRGAQATRAELDVIADYLFENFPKMEDATKINVNKATAQGDCDGAGSNQRRSRSGGEIPRTPWRLSRLGRPADHLRRGRQEDRGRERQDQFLDGLSLAGEQADSR